MKTQKSKKGQEDWEAQVLKPFGAQGGEMGLLARYPRNCFRGTFGSAAPREAKDVGEPKLFLSADGSLLDGGCDVCAGAKWGRGSSVKGERRPFCLGKLCVSKSNNGFS